MAEPNAPTSRRQSRQAQTDRVQLVQNRIASARAVRDWWRRRFEVQSLYEHFLGDLGGVIIGNESSSDNFSVNKFLPTIKTIQPSLFLQNPMFIVRSKKENIDPSSTLKAQMGQAALRAIADQEYHLEFSIRLALLQSFFSLAVLKCSYRPKLIKNPRAGEMMVETDQAGVPSRSSSRALFSNIWDERQESSTRRAAPASKSTSGSSGRSPMSDRSSAR